MLDATVIDRLVERDDKLALDALCYIDELSGHNISLEAQVVDVRRELLAARERTLELTRQIETMRAQAYDHPFALAVRYGALPGATLQSPWRG